LFSQNFAFSLPARVDFVGGGGKTSLILKLMEEYSESMPVVYTTTTRIHPPHPSEGLVVISSDNEAYLQMMLEHAVLCWCARRRFVATRLSHAPDLLRGVNPGFGNRLDRVLFPLILNEADGARSMSLKMPREGEPVLLDGANYLVPVIGLDCLNRPLGPKALFRWELASQRYQLNPGEPLIPELAASILLHPQGVCKGWKPGVHIIPFINKVDSESDDPLALSLAAALLRNGSFPVERVVWGSTYHSRVASLNETADDRG
jgi:probable selenium-dependent hydroxylase accessory protein YqeC